MIILGIETSCDETAAAVLEQKDGRIQILSNSIASSAQLQSKYGGIIPEQAAREQLKSIIPVIEEALTMSQVTSDKLDAIAVTYGPGLIGSLLVGVETAKTLALLWNKPLIPVNHLMGHFYANWIDQSTANRQQLTEKDKIESASWKLSTESTPKFPCIGLLVSGGHTDLVLFKDHTKYKHLGGTRDDAAGECFDKCARILGLPYPGGPEISRLATNGDPSILKLPSPMIDSKDFDFSFSGLKTAVANLVNNYSRNDKKILTDTEKTNICASIEKAIIDVLAKKTIAAAQKYNVEQIIVAGGVAANQQLVDRLQGSVDSLGIKLFVPKPELCTDNAAMIASTAFFLEPTDNPLSIQANPNLSL